MKTPHDYQLAARDHIFAKYDAGERRGLLVMPTGTGKTFTNLLIAEEVLRRNGRLRALFLVHREELADQAIREFAQLVGPDNVGRIQGARSQFGRDVSVAMVQSAAQVKRLARLTAADHNYIAVDEAHHGTENSQYGMVLHALFRPDTLVVGLTATPNRADGIGLDLYDYWHEPIDMAEAIERGYLCDWRAISVPLDLDLSSCVRPGAADFAERPLAQIMSEPSVIAQTVETWKRHARDRKTIGFCVTKDHARKLAAAFRAAGVHAAHVDEGTPREERQRLYADLASGALSVLLSVGILTEGFDERSVSCVLLVRPTQSKGLLTQMVGRGLRTHPDKSLCLVLDVTGRLEDGALVSLPMIGGLPDDDDEDLSESQKEAVRRVVREDERGGKSFESFTAVARAAREVNLLRIPRGRRYQWLEHEMGLVLSLGRPEAGMLVVRRHTPERDGAATAGRWKIVHMHQRRGKWRWHVLAERQHADDAIGRCEQEARRFSPPRSGIQIGPASPAEVGEAVRDITATEKAVNAGRSTPLVGASRDASAASVGELRRRGVRITPEQAADLTHGEVETMLRQLHAGGPRAVRLPARVKGAP